MKIREIKLIVCSPGRHFITAKVSTHDSVYGVGDATMNEQADLPIARLEDGAMTSWCS
jgi:mannonate dehydratase